MKQPTKLLNFRRAKALKAFEAQEPLFVVKSSVGEMLMTLEAFTAFRFYLSPKDRQNLTVSEITASQAAESWSFVWTAHDVLVIFGGSDS